MDATLIGVLAMRLFLDDLIVEPLSHVLELFRALLSR